MCKPEYSEKITDLPQVTDKLYHIIHLLTGYEGNSPFIAPKVPTIFRGNAGENSFYRGDNKSAISITRISNLSVLLYRTTVQFKILNCRPFSDGFLVYFISGFFKLIHFHVCVFEEEINNNFF